ncbi:hypothetical protein [Pectobacterium brasiliense]|uniref:hypothetical protein n=1 Tax=Pectobacterium brasiliense TaxID=180957 RepID=UPI00057E3F46|nr:hypothetical protein [Pectobacterium brasiliense]APS28799.1 hypothetical protein NC16_03245 [Pectobacterium brasiliense]KHT04357.1 hypothetical protein RC91_08290 [Pectobacterium brasiliense]MBN3103089.1 hypothetical protein [Pectobacterium brasiliense]MBN3181483.1 hypothetical protein [Pectobacterium brasiliense]PPE63143.1 Antitoxin ChpS [Pectobacterium brasiliense]
MKKNTMQFNNSALADIEMKKWGNSIGTIWPSFIVKKYNLDEGTQLSISVDNENEDELRIVFSKKKKVRKVPKYSLDQLLAECDPNAPSVGDMWEGLEPSGKEIY